MALQATDVIQQQAGLLHKVQGLHPEPQVTCKSEPDGQCSRDCPAPGWTSMTAAACMVVRVERLAGCTG